MAVAGATPVIWTCVCVTASVIGKFTAVGTVANDGPEPKKASATPTITRVALLAEQRSKRASAGVTVIPGRPEEDEAARVRMATAPGAM